MKKTCMAFILTAFASLFSPARAQEKPNSGERAARATSGAPLAGSEQPPRRGDITPLRVQVVFNEFDGEKRISSLPYTISINADEPSGPRAQLRMGLRVPVQTGGPDGAKQFQYIDMGTNIDGSAEKEAEGRFGLHLSVERSSAYSPTAGQKPSIIGGAEINSIQPVIQQFKTSMHLRIRDGQTIQSTVSTDPVTGRVIKVDVTLTVLK